MKNVLSRYLLPSKALVQVVRRQLRSTGCNQWGGWALTVVSGILEVGTPQIASLPVGEGGGNLSWFDTLR